MNIKRLLSLLLMLALPLLPMGCKSKSSPNQESTHAEKGKDEHEEGSHSDEHGSEDKVKLTPEQMKSSGIQLVKAAERPLRIEVEAVGEIASDTDRLTQIRPEFPGTIKEFLVAVGDPVEANQVLVRYAKEGDSGEKMELKSPQHGVIVGLYGEIEGHVDPSVPLATVADTSRLRCGLDVYEKDIVQIRKGQKVRIKIAAIPNQNFDGQVTYISPRVDPESRTVKVRVDVANPAGKLKFGMFITGFVQVGARQTLTVPEAAIQNINGKPTVFVAEEAGTFVPKEVSIGQRSQGWVEIKSGVKAGETVVGEGSFVMKSELSKGELGEGHGH